VTDLRHHTVQVPATTANLGPGYDAFGLALDRFLAVRSRPRQEQTERIVTRGEGAAELPTDDTNLVWRSLVTFCDHHGVPVPNVALEASTTIPLERGLGSSSAAIVAGLTMARALTGVVTGDREVVTLAAELEGHPDNVGPAVLGGLVACAETDHGELVIRRVNPAARLRPCVLVPAGRQSTEAARAVVPDMLSREDVTRQAARAGHVLAALTGTWPVAPGLTGDRLHEPPRSAVMKDSGAVIERLRTDGVHAWLSGAGPAIAVAVPMGDTEVLDRVRTVGREQDFTVLELAFELSGALACPDDGCALAGVGGCVQCPRRRV
jgi:homoserine kinase